VNTCKSYINNDKQLSIAFLLIDLHGAVSDCLNFSSRFMPLPVKDIPSPTTSKLLTICCSSFCQCTQLMRIDVWMTIVCHIADDCSKRASAFSTVCSMQSIGMLHLRWPCKLETVPMWLSIKQTVTLTQLPKCCSHSDLRRHYQMQLPKVFLHLQYVHCHRCAWVCWVELVEHAGESLTLGP
jgi:hypothetical protein